MSTHPSPLQQSVTEAFHHKLRIVDCDLRRHSPVNDCHLYIAAGICNTEACDLQTPFLVVVLIATMGHIFLCGTVDSLHNPVYFLRWKLSKADPFAQSWEEPPPKEIMESQPFSLNTLNPASTLVSLGFGSAPPNTTLSTRLRIKFPGSWLPFPVSPGMHPVTISVFCLPGSSSDRLFHNPVRSVTPVTPSSYHPSALFLKQPKQNNKRMPV